jgi:hypothetical protein
MALDRRRNPNRGPGEKPRDVDARGNNMHTPPHGTEIPGSDDHEPTPEDLSDSRERLYQQHLFAADHFAGRAQEIEDRDRGSLNDEDICCHGAFVSGAVFSAAAFLETSITDLYLELQKLSQTGQRNLRRELAMLPRVWPEIVGSPVLHKYQLALSVADADQYNESRSPYFDADSLIHLRDSLLTFTPEWDDKRGRHHSLQKRLFAKFPPNPFAPENSPWFPDYCLSAGCAKWAVRAAQFFSDDFCHRMAIPARAQVSCDRP